MAFFRAVPSSHEHGGTAKDMDVTITIYGIKNCDTMKKARAWLDKHGIAYDFHDYKAKGIEAAQVEAWARRPAGRR